MAERNLVQVFMPSLAALLIVAEKRRRRPLTEKEVTAIKNTTTVMMLIAEAAQKLDEQRGYKDINPENCWDEWQELRKKIDFSK